jgi:hypothetical protein
VEHDRRGEARVKIIRSIEIRVKYTETDELVPGRTDNKEWGHFWYSQGSLVVTEGAGLSLTVNYITKDGKTTPVVELGPLLI